MKDGFIRVAAATPQIRVADCQYNKDRILDLIREAALDQACLVVFPELCLTGYTCGDLFLSRTLQQEASSALIQLAEAAADLEILCVAGLPLSSGSALYNVAAVFQSGRLLGIVPKRFIPNYGEFYEARHFTSGPPSGQITIGSQVVPFGTDLVFHCREQPDFRLGVEICEDLWAPCSPSVHHALAGATVIANLSASDEIITKAAYRRLLVQSHSGRLVCGYIYADAGDGESTTDLVFAGHNLIYENGRRLAESNLFSTGITSAELDVQMLAQERRRLLIFNPAADAGSYRHVAFSSGMPDLQLRRKIDSRPFVPADSHDLAERCEEILSLQVAGLKKRLAHTACRAAIIGLSGGLDSSLALLVSVRAFDSLRLDRTGIWAVTMPGFGTTNRTYQNALALAYSLGVTVREIPIGDAVLNHFSAIKHDPAIQDSTYENAQARERTQILMDLANKAGGLVIGTGDLSELALGWATYNGDHMSMYGVNCSIPKTLVRHLIRHVADHAEPAMKKVLADILDTPVSPELLPPQQGEIVQKTEHLIGPYELHDFFLYYLVRYGFTPEKIRRLARIAFEGQITHPDIDRWLKVFIQRFFSQQFKRSCLPDGPKVGSVTLSPRGDWRMPSDASADLWLKWADNPPLP